MVDQPSSLIDDHENKLADEIHAVLRQRELQVSKYQGASSLLCFRRILVDWLAVISEKLHLSHGILHISVKLLDIVMDKCELNKRCQLNLLALCCLWIAAKLDERDDLIPRVDTLRTFIENKYFHEDFLQMELSIMQILDWRLMIPTPVQFFDYYLKHIICEDDYHVGFPITHVERARTYVKKYAMYFLGVVLQDHVFNEYLPSLVMCSALAASRFCLKISPTWPLQMAALTGYSFEQLEPCVDKLLKYHEDDQGRCKSSSVN